MPTAKKLRSAGPVSDPVPTRSSAARKDAVVHPMASGIQDEQSDFVKTAQAHWLKPTKKNAKIKVKNDVLKRQVWDLLEKDGFPYKSLLELESLNILESYLWPGYTDASSNIHVTLIALISNVKRQEHVNAWGTLEGKPADFSSMFRRVLALTVDTTQSPTVRTQLVSFLIYAFQSLDCGTVRKECVPLVSISIWHNLSSEALRESKLSEHSHVRKVWRASLKRYDASDDATKARVRFERSWLYTLALELISLLHSRDRKPDHVRFCERLVEFFCDLQSQLPTRRYVNSLLQDIHLLPVMKLSPMYDDEGNHLLREMHELLAHYTYFIVDDHTGAQLSATEAYNRHCKTLGNLQRVALKHFREKLTILALSNYGAISKREELGSFLSVLTDDELVHLASLLALRTSFPEPVGITVDRKIMTEIVLYTFERRQTFREIARTTSLVPTEACLFDNNLSRTDGYDGSRPLGLPKLNLQYLSAGDFLWRTFSLYRYEAFYAIRRDIELVLGRLRVGRNETGGIQFNGYSKMAVASSGVSILEVAPPLIGEEYPSQVRAELSLDLRRAADRVRKEWDSLRPDDVVFLLTARPPDPKPSPDSVAALAELDTLGLVSIRAAEVVQMQDEGGRYIRPGTGAHGPHRRLIVKLDPATYSTDADHNLDVYKGINVVIRRHSRENNFKRVLESIRALLFSNVSLPDWIHEVFLGYGDPAGATYKHLPNRIRRIDFKDTFLDWQHLVEGLPGKTIDPCDEASGSFPPPYVLEEATSDAHQKAAAVQEPKPSKKRRRDVEPPLLAEIETFKVSTYKPPNCGPYPADSPRLNKIRFTAAQIDAIISGTQPGLTVIVGPPGTGKTDVATQIISNIYHNFPEQKTLLIAHSNQALNQLFAKIVALDIDDRHLLRLGHGEDELETESNFSKHGRVESFLENRDAHLREVTRLAASIGAPGAHGNSAETAGYFHTVYIQTGWARFEQVLSAPEASAADVVAAFPYHGFFSDAPQPLFPPDANRDAVAEIATGCYRHISNMFSQLVDAQPFEILRKEKDRTDYLLTNEARIIAMTSTHAAMRRGEITALGFRYDNIVMEEAAQITEAESFLPLTMQKPRNGRVPLQRVVLVGDHLQNSPVVQNMALRHYSNLEQSLFSRLVRLGVPTLMLDHQGRARSSIAALYQWRYPKLGNLPHILADAEYLTANAGFKYDYQFVNVPDFKGRGESEPSPHFIQNMGEAEYAVAVFQYMRLLGYPASKIAILTTYAGQRALVRDILAHRCRDKDLFGTPRTVATVDKYQGEQNDYIILSLTRSTKVGYLRDVRRMTVALSRARLGLYILGRREVFESCHELAPAFSQLVQRPDKLMLVTGEMWPSRRVLSEESGVVAGEVVMEGVEHLGQYVYEMVATKIEHMKAENSIPMELQEPETIGMGVLEQPVGGGDLEEGGNEGD